MTASSPLLSIALVIFRLAPAGGLEQHALRLAGILAQRGHEVTLITTRAPTSPTPRGVRGEQYAARGFTNHNRLAAFAEDAAKATADRFDVTVVFHAIPGFDVIFCADPSRARPEPWRALLPRYRTFARLEREALAPAAGATILCLSSAQRAGFAVSHETPSGRLILLPPTVDRHTVPAQRPSSSDRAEARIELLVAGDEPVWLWMGLQAKTKGLDRVLAALASFPAPRLVVTGLDPTTFAGAETDRLARRLGVSGRIRWLGFCDEATLRQARVAADLLVHPSRADVTGTVILEAMASGLPVITTEVCGFSEHVIRAAAGIVLTEPFQPDDLEHALGSATPSRLATWSANAFAYTRRDEFYSGLERAADIIETAPHVAPSPEIA